MLLGDYFCVDRCVDLTRDHWESPTSLCSIYLYTGGSLSCGGVWGPADGGSGERAPHPQHAELGE